MGKSDSWRLRAEFREELDSKARDAFLILKIGFVFGYDIYADAVSSFQF